MKNKAGKMILLTGALCILSFAVCACGGAKETPDAEEQQEALGEPLSEDEEQDKDSDPKAADTGNEQESPEASAEPESGEGGDKGTETDGTSGEWSDSAPDLEGDIKDLEDGRLTVVEAIQEKADDGGDIMISPGSGDDSEFNKVAVTYDQNTLFKMKTIYDGGASSELSEATAADMTSGQMVEVWGSFSGDSLKAARICIIKVV